MPTEETPAVIEQTEVPSTEPLIPKHRFDQINDKLNEYKELGLSPTDIIELVTEYRHLVDKQVDAKSVPAAEAARDEELRKGIKKLVPEIDDIAEIKADVQRTKATSHAQELQTINKINREASNHTKALFKDAGFSTETYSELYKTLEDAVANDIYNNPDKQSRFYAGDIDVVTETFKKYETAILSHVPKPKKEEKDLSFLSGKKGLTLPASALDDKVRAGKPLTRDEMRAMHNEVFSLMQREE